GPENPGAAIGSAPPGNESETPFNTIEIGPTSMNKSTSGYSTATSATATNAPPYSPSSARFVTSGPAVPLDAGDGKVSAAPAPDATGFAASSSALDASKAGAAAGIAP
ncbi:MAG: hypothetical protein WBV99_02775, partial [Candidatus Binatus sp.]